MRTFLIILVFLGVLPLSFLHGQAPNKERIFYSSFRPEGWDILLSTDGGASFEPFSSHPALEYEAVISPDGKWVIFTSEQLGSPSLFIRPLDKSAPASLLVESEAMQDQACFSPDGQQIAFVSTHEGNADIYLLPFLPDSTQTLAAARNLTHHPGGDFRPAFSPDGSTLAFSSDRDHPVSNHKQFSFAMHRIGNIYTTDLMGSPASRLTHTKGWDGSPAWSTSGDKIYFYSEREQAGQYRIYAMNADGSNPQAVSPEGVQAVSPVPLPNGKLAFTSWREPAPGEAPPFRLLLYDPQTKKLDSLNWKQANLFKLQVQAEGKLMVGHGNPEPTEALNNKGGFSGELLVKGGPENKRIAGKETELYGVRRAFAAPAHPTAPELIFADVAIRSATDPFTGWSWGFLLFPLVLLGLFVLGIVQAIRKRKQIKPWRYLLFALGALLLTALLLALLFYLLMISRQPLFSVRGYVLGAVVLFLLVSLLAYRSYRKAHLRGQPKWRVRKLMFLSLGVASGAVLYIGLFLTRFIEIPIDFYQVNYAENRVDHLFQLKEVNLYHPMNSQILDMKYTPDGESILFSIGSFRADPFNQGDIWRVDRRSLQRTKLSDSDFNDAFGEYAREGKHFVFRSGRSGFFDIYLQEGDSLVNLTQDEARDNFPTISPNGRHIAYCSDKQGQTRGGKTKTVDIYLISRNEAGSWSPPRKITGEAGQEAHPHFSPDGQWLIYTSEEGGINDEQPLIQPYIFSPQMYGEIYAVHLTDGTKVRLTHNKWEDGAPLWTKPVQRENTLAAD